MSTTYPGSSEPSVSRFETLKPIGSGEDAARQPEWLMSLDEPAEGQAFGTGEVLVRGWASDTFGPPSITAKVGELPLVEIAYGRSRTDVARAHPERKSAASSGFAGRIAVSSLPPGKYNFLLTIRRAAGPVIEIRRELQVLERSQMVREAAVNLAADSVRLKVEEPVDGSPALCGSVLKVSGWAVSKTAIDGIDVSIDGRPPQRATYGLMREEINALYDDFPGSSHSGFLWMGQTAHLSSGSHSLLVSAKSKSGNTAEVLTSFEIDQRSEYELWAAVNVPSRDQLLALNEESDRFTYTPQISIITPVYRTPEPFLRKCVDSVRKQVYPHWELILVDDCSGDRRLSSVLQSFAEEDRRIRVRTLPSNLGIAGATNAGLEMCRGEYVGLLDHDDEISADALFRVVEALNEDQSIDILYSDEDKIDANGKHQDGFFKPDWSPDLLLSMNYVCHFLVSRRKLLKEIGGLRLGFDGSQDYDLILRLSEQSEKIHRIPKVLYHWRIHDQSTASGVDVKPAASDAGRRAIEEHLGRKGATAEVVELGPGRYRVKYKIEGTPEVAIIIPTGGSKTLLAALESIRAKTTYPNYRIVVVDNSRSEAARNMVEAFLATGRHVDLLNCRGLPFNFSLLCNRAAQAVDSPYLLFLNDDTSVITPGWIEAMVEHAQRTDVGAVGAQLLFPNDTIQHAGVVTGLFEAAGHPFRGMPDKPYYFDFSHMIRNCAAVTGACLLTRRNAFESVGGYDEPNLPTCFQDVDLCLKMIEKGYRIVYTPFARLYHYESFSKKSVAELPEITFMKERWRAFIANDPFYNPNLTRRSDDFSLNYDQLFAPKTQAESGQGSGPVATSPAIDTQVARKIARLGKIEFYASPNPARPTKRGLGQTTIHWSVPGSDKIQVRVGSPRGPLFAEGGSQGKSSTGPWVESGTVFYLQDATDSDPSSPECVLATARVTVTPLSKATSAH